MESCGRASGTRLVLRNMILMSQFLCASGDQARAPSRAGSLGQGFENAEAWATGRWAEPGSLAGGPWLFNKSTGHGFLTSAQKSGN